MMEQFDPKNYVPAYQKASDLEHVKGMWVHPKVAGTDQGYAKDEIIVAIAGKPSYNGEKLHGASSIYFGPENGWSESIHLAYEETTGHKSQICAVRKAIDKTWIICNACQIFTPILINDISSTFLKRIIIKFDSHFLAEAMTPVGFRTMKEKSWRKSHGEAVGLREAVERMEPRIEELEQAGVEVFFWHVSKEENSEAHGMADEAYKAQLC
ncbi:hypothetical protein F5B20DRAFT_586384 [Whalleya microplaca]|nr:hypothetical protein F5B20DRAFT_586384 [Whalleya microplaca]